MQQITQLPFLRSLGIFPALVSNQKMQHGQPFRLQVAQTLLLQ